MQVTPQKSQDGTCRLGAWVRDNMQGIGTLTFVEPDGTFAALGHGISDVDTGKMLQLNGGELYLTQILSVIPGKAGVPGELQGVIHYEEKNRIGSVAENTIYGIHGVLDREKSSALPLTVTEIAYRQEIETGPATVRMCVDNTVEEYEAEITEIDLGSENTNKNFVLEITDQRLLQKTGGISEHDMFNTFNMGVGMCVIVAPEDADRAMEILRSQGEQVTVIGEVVPRGESEIEIC